MSSTVIGLLGVFGFIFFISAVGIAAVEYNNPIAQAILFLFLAFLMFLAFIMPSC